MSCDTTPRRRRLPTTPLRRPTAETALLNNLVTEAVWLALPVDTLFPVRVIKASNQAVTLKCNPTTSCRPIQFPLSALDVTLDQARSGQLWFFVTLSEHCGELVFHVCEDAAGDRWASKSVIDAGFVARVPIAFFEYRLERYSLTGKMHLVNAEAIDDMLGNLKAFFVAVRLPWIRIVSEYDTIPIRHGLMLLQRAIPGGTDPRPVSSSSLLKTAVTKAEGEHRSGSVQLRIRSRESAEECHT